jgi:cytochrome c oxidase assembly factor CtaG
MIALELWTFDPPIVMALAAAAVLYWLGLTELWAREKGRGVRVWEAGCFWIGWASLMFALLSPIHTLSESLFFMHMTQHEILILVAAPLMVLGKPGLVSLKAFPQRTAGALARVIAVPFIERAWVCLCAPLSAWIIHAAALWLWHIPAAFDATLHSNAIHAAQHLSFFGSAMLFWWSVMHSRQRRLSYGLAVLHLFTTAMHSGLLGALLTLSRTIWYPSYAHGNGFGISPLEDQQLGGLIMWIPAGLVYVIAGLAFMAGWMRESEARVSRFEALA